MGALVGGLFQTLNPWSLCEPLDHAPETLGIMLGVLLAAGLNSRDSGQRRNHILPKSGQDAAQ